MYVTASETGIRRRPPKNIFGMGQQYLTGTTDRFCQTQSHKLSMTCADETAKSLRQRSNKFYYPSPPMIGTQPPTLIFGKPLKMRTC
jgi:hypothetical protein